MPPKVNRERCIGCGTCTRTCPFNVFELRKIETGEERSYVMRPENCEYYGACVHQCPRQAITLYYPRELTDPNYIMRSSEQLTLNSLPSQVASFVKDGFSNFRVCDMVAVHG